MYYEKMDLSVSDPDAGAGPGRAGRRGGQDGRPRPSLRRVRPGEREERDLPQRLPRGHQRPHHGPHAGRPGDPGR